jgi:hypothetical protein
VLPLTTILYLALFVSAVLGSILFNPLIGMTGYLITYHINPLTHWWGEYIPASIERYSLILGVATFIGMMLHKSKLKFTRMIEAQEILLILFVGLCWLSIPLGFDLGVGIDEHVIKMTKIGVIVLMASHLITDIRRYEMIVYIFIFTGLFLGIETYNAPTWYFAHGRLGQGVGGSDLSNGNMLAAHFIMVLSLIGGMFIKGGWKTKLLCSASAVFMLNGIVLIRSRGSFLGLLACAMSAVFFTKNVSRKKIIICLLAVIIGGVTLMDTGFLERMKLIQFDTEKMESSARSRVDVWLSSIKMVSDYPLGVGVGNTIRLVGQYDPSHEGLDTHNTYLRCLTDIGFQGLLVLLLLIANAFRILSSISKDIEQLKNKETFFWHIYGVKIGLIAYLTVVFFVSATYTEDFYWFLMFPVFLKRAVENEIDRAVSNNDEFQ